jgi:hypothetical protein
VEVPKEIIILALFKIYLKEQCHKIFDPRGFSLKYPSFALAKGLEPFHT